MMETLVPTESVDWREMEERTLLLFPELSFGVELIEISETLNEELGIREVSMIKEVV